MYSSNIITEINRLKFENFLWLLFAFLCLLNIFGDKLEKEYLETDNNTYKNNSNKVFEFTLIITFFIYIYFFIRNYKAYQKADESEKQLYTIKVLGSSLLIAGVICLIYFQTKQESFVGSPSL